MAGYDLASPIGFLRDRFLAAAGAEAVVLAGQVSSYGQLLSLIDEWKAQLVGIGVSEGSVVMLRADYCADAVACLLAIIDLRACAVPVTPACANQWDDFGELGQVEVVVELGASTPAARTWRTERSANHEHYRELRSRRCPGLVLFSSGSTGESKATVHDASRLLQKFHRPRKNIRTLAFLLFDHIGGLDTLFYCLSNQSVLVFTDERDPETVARLIEQHRIGVLPTAPSFLNLFLLSGVHERFDLSSLEFITYGAEMMPQSTLERCADAFPGVTLLQKYGTSEIGTMRSRSKDNRSRWIRIGGEGYEWRVREGKLEVRSESAMLGYLNAESPFTDDGFFMTGDCVEVEGEYIRFMGRDSDIINVGGQKVFPAEVEAAIKELPEVLEVVVSGRPNPMLGSTVSCKIRTIEGSVGGSEFRSQLRRHLMQSLEPYKVPTRIELVEESLTTSRFKHVRNHAG